MTGQVGLFFHVYPHNSVQSFHLHIVDLDVTGPTHEAMKYKNMPAEDVLAVLRAALQGSIQSRSGTCNRQKRSPWGLMEEAVLVKVPGDITCVTMVAVARLSVARATSQHMWHLCI